MPSSPEPALPYMNQQASTHSATQTRLLDITPFRFPQSNPIHQQDPLIILPENLESVSCSLLSLFALVK